MKTRHTVRKMNLSVPFISNIRHYANDYVEPRFSAVINGELCELTGKTKPFLESRETSFDVDIRDIDIPYYLNYLPMKLNCKLASANLDLTMNIRFVFPKEEPPSIKLAGGLSLKNVELDDMKKGKVLRLPTLNIALASADPLIPDIHIAKISIQSPEVVIKKNKEGAINLLNLLAQDKKTKPGERKARRPGRKRTAT